MDRSDSTNDLWEHFVKEFALVEFSEIVDRNSFFDSINMLTLEPDGFVDKHPLLEAKEDGASFFCNNRIKKGGFK